MAQAQLSIIPDNLGAIPEGLPLDQERALVEAAVRKQPHSALSIALMLLNDKHRYRAVAEERGRLLDQLATAPLVPATLLARIGEDRALVAYGNRQAGVMIAPSVDRASLQTGSAVLLSRDQSAIVEFAPHIPRAGLVGRFSRWHGTQAVVRGPSDEEHILHTPDSLAGAGFTNGDHILFDREGLVALDRVPSRHEHANLLEELHSDLRIQNLGALDEVFQSILDDILIYFLHPEVARRYRLDPVRSITLIGPPGVGKTSLVKCLAYDLSERANVEVRVFLARPSIHRSKWYGESEEKVRAMFEEVKRLARESGYVILFFDDVDQIGSRDTINDVDARVLPAFLHEVESLREVDRVLLVAATNKPELVDPALARAGRLGDREYRVPRPGTREATGQILRCYLDDGVVPEALGAMYSPNGELATLARLQFRDGSSRPLTPAMVVSGALLKNAAQAANQRACRRVLKGGPEGVTSEDLLAALAAEFANVTARLKPGPTLHALLDLPPDLDVVRVDRTTHPNRRAYLRGGPPPSARAASSPDS